MTTDRASIPAPFTEQTRGLCPTCLIDVPVRLFEDGGRIWIEQQCPLHGDVRALVASDAAEYVRLRQFVPDRTGANCCCGPGEACDNGAPPTCVLLLEITQACNLRCPTCYADAHGHDFMTLEEAGHRLDAFFAVQPRLDVLMLSGGEPTIHPQFAEMLELSLTYPIERVLVNTNGLRVAHSDEILGAIAIHRDRVELFLSFSSFRPAVHERLYGRDLRDEKTMAIDRAASRGVYVTLVPTVERGVNDDEIGDLYRFALANRNVNGLNFQPVMQTGRYDHDDFRPGDRLTLTDVIAALESQTNGDLRSSDFVGLPCSHPDCCALTFCFLNAARTQATPLPRHLDVARYMDLFADRISFSGLVGAALRRVWSDLVNVRSAKTVADLFAVCAAGGIRDVLPLIGKPDAMASRVLRVVVKPFMDAHCYDQNRIDQCCTKIVDENGQTVSFCEYNVLRRTARIPTRAIALPMLVGRVPSARAGGAETSEALR